MVVKATNPKKRHFQIFKINDQLQKKNQDHNIPQKFRSIKINRHLVDLDNKVINIDTIQADKNTVDSETDENDSIKGIERTKTFIIPEDRIQIDFTRPSYSSSEDSQEISNHFTETDAINLITEANIKQLNESKNVLNKPLRRFIIGRMISPVNINDVIELNDYRNRDLFDKLEKRCVSGGFTKNWVKLRNNNFTCYKTKQYLTNKDDFILGDFINPVDKQYFYKVKYSIDLGDSKIYLVILRTVSYLFAGVLILMLIGPSWLR